jgi:tRNA (guanine37-N1)-methyltransferase
MKFQVLSALPDLVEAYAREALLGRAQKQSLIQVAAVPLRKFSDPPHFQIDDQPFGGGPGMLLKCEPIVRALSSLDGPRHTVLLSAKGKKFDQVKAREFSKLPQLVLICGRYEGVDQRIADHYVDEEIRVGDFVMMGGELAALSIIEATARLIPGVLGNEDSPAEESFEGDADFFEYPQYTRPRVFEGHEVPEVLLSGDHKKIQKWRESQRKSIS